MIKRRSFLSGLTLGIASIWLPPDPESKIYSFISRPNFNVPTLRIYSGKVPRDADSPIKNNFLLSEIQLTKRGNEFNGTDFSANNTGIATFARLYDSNGLAVMDFRGNSMGLNTPYISSGCTIMMGMHIENGLILT